MKLKMICQLIVSFATYAGSQRVWVVELVMPHFYFNKEKNTICFLDSYFLTIRYPAERKNYTSEKIKVHSFSTYA